MPASCRAHSGRGIRDAGTPSMSQKWTKEEKSAYNKAYYLKRRTELLARKAKQHKENPEKFRKRALDYIAANKEKVRTRVKARYDANPEFFAKKRKERAPYMASYYENNREYASEQSKKWRENHPSYYNQKRALDPAKFRNYANRRRAMKKGLTIGNQAILIAWQRRIRKSESVRCYWCQEIFNGTEIHFDHIIALNLDGPHEIGNLCASCRPCNNKKLDRTVSRWNTFLKSPVLF